MCVYVGCFSGYIQYVFVRLVIFVCRRAANSVVFCTCRRQAFENNIAKLDADPSQKNALRRRYHMQELQHMRYQLKRFTTNDFDSLAVIGKGAFGEVGDGVIQPLRFLDSVPVFHSMSQTTEHHAPGV